MFILATIDRSVLSTLGAVDALTISWPPGTQNCGPITLCAARQARSVGLQSLTACRVSEFSIDVLRERYSIESRHTCIVLEAFLYRLQHSSRHRFRLLLL